MLAFLLLLVIVKAETNGTVKETNLKLANGEKIAIESPSYPDNPPIGTKLTWYISSESDSNVLLNCEDLRITWSENCDKGYFLVNDGIREDRYCDTAYELSARSVKNQMKLEFDLNWASGMVKCEVTTIGKDMKDPDNIDDGVEYIKLNVNGPAFEKLVFKKISGYRNKIWHFETTPNDKISIFCEDINLGPSCDEGYLITSGGYNDEKICGTRRTFLLDKSVSNTLSIELKTSKLVKGVIDCIVQAISGENTFQYENIKSEEIDSSEYGQGIGIRNTNCDCGFSRKNPARIVNGDFVEERQYPWIVALLYNDRNICGGSIITEEHILTAAHCTADRLAKDFKIITGTNNVTHTIHGQIIPVKEIIAHNAYDRGNFHLNDVAIMWLAEKIKFSQYVGRVCLTPNKLPLLNKYITVLGWGRLGPPGDWESPQMMRRAHLRVVDYNTCSFLWHRGLNTSVIDRVCAWSSNRTACFGDSGGPLVWHDPDIKRYVQVGLTSFGPACEFTVPIVNTNVAHFYAWIMKVIKETSPLETCIKK